MSTRDDLEANLDWSGEEPEDELESDMEMDDDGDYFLDDAEEDESDDEETVSLTESPYLEFSARRRIEIAREDKSLKSLLADFDDYDNFESFDASFSAGHSH